MTYILQRTGYSTNLPETFKFPLNCPFKELPFSGLCQLDVNCRLSVTAINKAQGNKIIVALQYIVNNMTITKFPIPWMLSSALWSISRLFKDHRWVLHIGPCWNSSRCWSQQTLRSPSCCLQGVSLDPPYTSYLMDQWKWPHLSLNDQLLVGPTVHPPLNDVLIRFRKHVLTTDVSKMYRAVTLAPEDRDFWRDIYWPNRGLFMMTRVTFGIATFLSSPLLQRPLKSPSMLRMAFPHWKQSKKPSHFIISFRASLSEKASNFSNGTQTRPKFSTHLRPRLKAQRTFLSLEILTALPKLLEWSTIPIKITSYSLPLNYPLKNHLLPNMNYCLIQQKSMTPLVSCRVPPL